MRKGTSGFIGARLVQARLARNLPSRVALARLIGKNSTTIGRWEDGAASPEPETLLDLARALRVRPEFFLRPQQLQESEPQAAFYRSLASTLKRDRLMQEARIEWLQEISSAIQHYVDLPTVDIPDVMEGKNFRQLRNSDIEGIARELRQHWQLGEEPISDIVTHMERIGVVVASEEMGTSKLDGLSQWNEVETRPYALLASDKMSFPRRQMDGAHELGHIVLHRSVSTKELSDHFKEIEAQAFRFASALLLPSVQYAAEVQSLSLSNLLLLKERWRVSVKAQIKRLRDLDLIDQDYGVHMYKMHSAKKWTKGEPLDDAWPLQKPRMLADALKVITDANVRSKDELLGCEFVVSETDVEQLTSLPEGWFSRRPAEVVKLKTDRAPAARGPAAGDILPFPSKH
jgi:Zn-dependent peptidase ImmA (M78 family)/transcriptional regulator with XRE-family HTH domain